VATAAIAAPARTGIALPAYSLWRRELVRFYRQRARVIGVIASPVLFWLLLGAGFGRSVRTPGLTQSYTEYFFPGVLIMIVLFTSIFTMMSVIDDRNEGFLLSVMVAPVHRASIVLGKVLGGATLAGVQGLVFLVFAPLVGIHFGWEQFGIIALVTWLVSFALTALGFAIAWTMESAQAFHAVVNLFLVPLWLISGALFPISSASGWIRAVMLANPLTYGVEALRMTLFSGIGSQEVFTVNTAILVLVGFSIALFVFCFAVVNRRSTKPAA
jgi:ABC-2 type transport system permease protein